MPLSKAGKKIKAKLEKHYGEKKGEGIFYAMENKGEIPGMNKMKGYAEGGDTKAKKKKEPKSKRPQPRPDPEEALVRAFGQYMTASRYFGLDEEGNSTRGIRGQVRPTQRPNTDREETPKKEDKRPRRRGYAEGGMVKSTGKMNTNIKKCGE
jgi:hypothetical protein